MLNSLLGDSAPTIGGRTLAHFYVGVREIDAIQNGQSVVLGSSSTPYQIDLLQYQNGSGDWMTQTSVPAQTYTQLRYVFDVGSTQAVFADGSTMPVRFNAGPSRSSSGEGASTSTSADSTYANAVDVVVNTQLTVQSDSDTVAADFNLAESLGQAPGALVVRPVVSAAADPGQINGTVQNANGNGVQGATVVAYGSNGAAVNSTATDASGAFNLHALPADTYQTRDL